MRRFTVSLVVLAFTLLTAYVAFNASLVTRTSLPCGEVSRWQAAYMSLLRSEPPPPPGHTTVALISIAPASGSSDIDEATAVADALRASGLAVADRVHRLVLDGEWIAPTEAAIDAAVSSLEVYRSDGSTIGLVLLPHRCDDGLPRLSVTPGGVLVAAVCDGNTAWIPGLLGGLSRLSTLPRGDVGRSGMRLGAILRTLDAATVDAEGGSGGERTEDWNAVMQQDRSIDHAASTWHSTAETIHFAVESVLTEPGT